MGAPGGASEVSAARMMMDGQSPSASRETRGGMESNETGASRQTMPMEGGGQTQLHNSGVVFDNFQRAEHVQRGKTHPFRGDI